MNALVREASNVARAVNALRLKRHSLRPNGEGVVIQQPGKPDLMLTYESARRFAQTIDEAAND